MTSQDSRHRSVEYRVIAAFPATGKTWLSTRTGYLDSDSSDFSWVRPGQRHPHWPTNYIDHITAAAREGLTVLVSTHLEVRESLRSALIPFTLVYPREDLRDEYAERMRGRGTDEAMVDFITTMWDDLLGSCRIQDGCEHFVLGPGQYLADVIA